MVVNHTIKEVSIIIAATQFRGCVASILALTKVGNKSYGRFVT